MFGIFSSVSLVGSANCWSHLGKFSVFAFLPDCCGTEVSAGCCWVLGSPGWWSEDRHWLCVTVLLSWALPGDREWLRCPQQAPLAQEIHLLYTASFSSLSYWNLAVWEGFRGVWSQQQRLSLASLVLQRDPCGKHGCVWCFGIKVCLSLLDPWIPWIC